MSFLIVMFRKKSACNTESNKISTRSLEQFQDLRRKEKSVPPEEQLLDNHNRMPLKINLST